MNILSTEIIYSVSLHNGSIVATVKSYPDIHGNLMCENLNKADFYSLNILRQNASEKLKTTGTYPTRVRRVVLGLEMLHYSNEIQEKMNYIRETFPEDFL